MRNLHTPILISIAAAIGGSLFTGCDSEPFLRKEYSDVSSVLSHKRVDSQFEKAVMPRRFVFPNDAGPHPRFRSEWWYYTGNLETADHRQFGYQFTIFRQALGSSPTGSQSQWRTNQFYMGHFAVTDVEENRFFSFSRMARGALGLSGARAEPYRVWLEDWEISGNHRAPGIVVQENDVAINLRLHSEKAEVLQGDHGLSIKSAGLGNASYYYSQTRLATSGTIRINDSIHQVVGFSWLDREWSTSSLGVDEVGWDWFSIQLDDRREIMLYGIRKKDGTYSSLSSGSLVLSNHQKVSLARQDFQITVLDFWTSPQTNIQYPSRWKIAIAKVGLEMEITPLISDQEHRHDFVYWEGAVSVQGNDSSGKGYVELVGYEKGR